jgi:nicotinamidase-related amidase
MSALFDASNPASPLAYDASHTALLLMDFQYFILNRCGPTGQTAVATAAIMRDWALKNGIMVVHSVIDVEAPPPETYKGADRIKMMMAELAKDSSLAAESAELATNQSEREYVVLKRPGQVSALKSVGAMDLLKEHDVRSLILCGLSTSGAVLRTAAPAVDEGFVVSVIEDGCGDPKEDLHDMLMKTALPSGAHVVKAREFIAQWEKGL